jgi:putative addiction module CopG family antidote
MDVRLSPDQEEFIRRAVEKGRYGKAEDVVREALAILQERERKRAEILEAVDFAEVSISRAAGGGLPQPATAVAGAKTKRSARRKRVTAARKA